MTEEQKNKIQNKIMILSVAVIVLLAACLVFLVATKRANTILLAVVGGVFLAVYWVISDVLPVVWVKSFEGKTDEEKKAYCIYAALNLISFGGLIYFIVDADSMYGVIIFAACIIIRRRFYDTFSGKAKEPEDETDPAAQEEKGPGDETEDGE